MTAGYALAGVHAVPAEQKARLHEVADLLLEIYRTLVRMRFLSPDCIETGPHEIDQQLAQKKELDPSIYYLHQILPYINVDKTDSPDFIQGGSFVDFRDADCVEQSRDPMRNGWELSGGKGKWVDDEGEYMRPWTTTLSVLGNHQTVIFYDAELHMIWMEDQESGHSTDLDIENGGEYIDNIEHSDQSFYANHGRDASQVLRDINQWFKDLRVTPGHGEQSHDIWALEHEQLARIYRDTGWLTGAFDGQAFLDEAAKKVAWENEYWDSRSG